MKRTFVAVAVATLALVAGGCDADQPSPRATADRPADTGPVVVPDLSGTKTAAARAAAKDLGLLPRVMPGAMSACVPAQTVVRQVPAAGTEVDAGSRVRLVINVGSDGTCGRDLPSAAPDLRRIGQRFVDFARDTAGSGRTGVPADTPVELFVGGLRQKAIPSAGVSDRNAWRACPGEMYAASGCPLSVLGPFVGYPGPIASTSQQPAHPCLRATPLPDRLDSYRSVTLTPDEDRACTSYFAVQLFVNDVDQVVAANLVLSEP